MMLDDDGAPVVVVVIAVVGGEGGEKGWYCLCWCYAVMKLMHRPGFPTGGGEGRRMGGI
jgi:hypothetical protein